MTGTSCGATCGDMKSVKKSHAYMHVWSQEIWKSEWAYPHTSSELSASVLSLALGYTGRHSARQHVHRAAHNYLTIVVSNVLRTELDHEVGF